MLNGVVRSALAAIDLDLDLVESFALTAAYIEKISAPHEGHLGRTCPSSTIVGRSEQK